MIGFGKVLMSKILTKSWWSWDNHKVEYLRRMIFEQIYFFLESKDSVAVLEVLLSRVSPVCGRVSSVGAVVVSLHPDRRHPHVRLSIAGHPELLEYERPVPGLVVEGVEVERREAGRCLCHGVGQTVVTHVTGTATDVHLLSSPSRHVALMVCSSITYWHSPTLQYCQHQKCHKSVPGCIINVSPSILNCPRSIT